MSVKRRGVPWPLQVVVVLFLVQSAVAFMYMVFVVHVFDFPRRPPDRDVIGETVVMMVILFEPSVLGGIIYALILNRRTRVATRRRALILSPIALAGVWLIVALFLGRDSFILAIVATLLFGLVVPLPHSGTRSRERPVPGR